MPTETPSGDDITTTTHQLNCPVCGTVFTRIRRQRFCSPNCRKTAWARTHTPPPHPADPVPAPRRRKDITVYQCPTCDNRYVGEQWCPDCTTPARRVDYGGYCPHCDEPVTIADLIPDTNTPR